jgi:hypothetical protein
MRSFTLAVLLIGFCVTTSECEAQITVPRILSAKQDRVSTLREQLINRLRATREEQRAYVSFVVEQVRLGRLDRSLVVALERYALRRNSGYPFPFFERALKYEALKRGVALPPVQQFATTRASTRATP